jgi:predicted protein tyrosine phosphatase
VSQPEIIILSERDAQAYVPSGREVCISVTGPHHPVPPLSEQFTAILRVAFSEIARPIDLPDYVLFNDQHARQILAFAKRWRDADRLIIHCQAGLSRSPGIAIGLCELFSWCNISDLEQKHSMANAWVRRELVRIGAETMARKTERQ